MRAGTEQLDARFQKGAEKLDANMKLGHQKYDSSASTIEKAHLEMRRELKRMEKVMTDLQGRTPASMVPSNNNSPRRRRSPRSYSKPPAVCETRSVHPRSEGIGVNAWPKTCSGQRA